MVRVNAERLVIEQAVWDVGAIKKATGNILDVYSHGLGEFGKLVRDDWEFQTDKALKSLRGLRYRIGGLNSAGIDLFIVGPHYYSPEWSTGDAIAVWEPRVELDDKTYGNATPSFRNALYHITQDAKERVFDLYGMRTDRDPVQFVFPKSGYATLTYSSGLLFRRN